MHEPTPTHPPGRNRDGLQETPLTCRRLCAWEHDPKVRPGEDYLDRLCRVYETRPDQLSYGHDYTVQRAGGDFPRPACGA